MWHYSSHTWKNDLGPRGNLPLEVGRILEHGHKDADCGQTDYFFFETLHLALNLVAHLTGLWTAINVNDLGGIDGYRCTRSLTRGNKWTTSQDYLDQLCGGETTLPSFIG